MGGGCDPNYSNVNLRKASWFHQVYNLVIYQAILRLLETPWKIFNKNLRIWSISKQPLIPVKCVQSSYGHSISILFEIWLQKSRVEATPRILVTTNIVQSFHPPGLILAYCMIVVLTKIRNRHYFQNLSWNLSRLFRGQGCATKRR